MPSEAIAFHNLKQAIIARTGHHYYADKDAVLRDRLERRLQASGATSFRQYEALLQAPDHGPVEWRALEAEITIGETFFFRHGEQFDALRKTILPDLLALAAQRRSLRIWSA